MKITHESTGKIGKFAAPRLNIFVDSTCVGVADYNPIHSVFEFEILRIPSEMDIILQAQKEGVSGDQMSYRCAQRQWAADALASATSPENLTAIKAYVAKIPLPEPEVAAPEPVRISTPIIPIQLLPVDLGLGLEQLFALVSRVDSIASTLKVVESALKEFDFKNVQAQLKSFAARIDAIEIDVRAQKSVMKVHLRSCRCYSGSSGFTPLD